MVDVFGASPLAGNPLAVVIDSEGLSDHQMLQITRWLNLSETTFLLPADHEEADYRVRIFTLAGELPFAGHPTLGTCHVWLGLQDESKNEIVQECGAGLVKLRRDGGLAFQSPPVIRDDPVDAVQLAEFAYVLGVEISDIVDARWVDNGPGWVGILLHDADRVLELEPDFTRHPKEETLDIGVVGFHPPDSECLYEVRAFFSGQSGHMLEDPVTGSLNASLAEWLISDGRASPPYVASQGTRLGRAGRVHISQGQDGAVWVDGDVTTIVSGTVDL